MSNTSLRLRVLPRFPARISGTNGIVTVRDNVDQIVKNDFSILNRTPAIDNPDKVFLLTWNSDLDYYSLMSFTDTFAAAIDVTGLMPVSIYDPTGKNQDIFAYADTKAALKLSLTGGVMTGAIQDAVFAPSSAATKKVTFDNSLITAGQQRNIKVPDADVALTKWELIGDYTAASVGSIAVTNLSAFRKIRIGGLVVPSAQASLLLRTSTDNGATYDSGATDYAYQVSYSALTAQNAGGAVQGFMLLTPAASDAGSRIAFECTIEGFNKAAILEMHGRTSFVSGASLAVGIVAGQRNNTVARNALALLTSPGTFSGNITIEGVRG